MSACGGAVWLATGALVVIAASCAAFIWTWLAAAWRERRR